MKKYTRQYIIENGIPEGLSLLRDTPRNFNVIDCKNTIIESHGREEKVLRVTGLMQEGDKPNNNRRLYPMNNVLRPAVEDIMEDVKQRSVIGNCDHPEDVKLCLTDASHLITKLWVDGKKVFGEAEILHRLPQGAILRGLFEHKVRVCISSRGAGDLEVSEDDSDILRVCEGYTLITFDAVADPSVNGTILKQINEMHNKVKTTHQKAKIDCAKDRKSLFTPEFINKQLVREINKQFGLN